MKIYLIAFLIVFLYKLLSNIASLISLIFVNQQYNLSLNNEPNYLLACSPFFDKLVSKYVHATSVFLSRIIECFNPFYWIELIIYLPKSIVNYLGFSSNKLFTKVLQLIWWIFTPLFLIFREKIIDYILKLFPW